MNRDKGFMIRIYAALFFIGICIFVVYAIGWLIITQPAAAPAPAPVVSYDKIEILYVGGRSAFRTPDGWNFAGSTGQNDGTVFIKKRVKE